ncbi:methyl-viologen-reducing hydrogenase delta subunit [Thermodesulfatator indicus DSM 15286]|uniref:Methyl-viologen-reducing hydrogenase delta subunit n=1 Tax=Thermodesulfatator indicus (strain DSM 15286 / JCM 11887 / CIR29812) TaxID=667014 RepID=F8A8A0_THEID|nr:hydrogenase iron-sulfur subunit [Thermodesulfatator indicus]AEH44627.1 methyl-viologen-reducing hydrogenase delta subunit [Thermodesulfatator indicus DSM 15286]
MKNENRSIGVVLCSCGGLLEKKIDFSSLAEKAQSLPDVEVVLKFSDFCLCPEDKLAEYKERFTHLLFVGCSERSSLSFDEKRLGKLLSFLGIDPGFAEVVNIKEQCFMIHEDSSATTAKALDLLQMGFEKLITNQPAHASREIAQKALVIGAGVAGMSCAKSLGDLGVKVTLVEEKSYIGGHACQIPLLWQSEGYPSVCTSECIGPVIARETLWQDNVSLFLSSKVTEVKKKDGNFIVTIEKGPQFVDPKKCMGCGECAVVCPETVPNDFDIGLKDRKVIDKSFKLAVPNVYHLIREACTECGECEKVCPTGAIDLQAKPEIFEETYGAVALATGFSGYDMNAFEKLSYHLPNVVTMLEFERLWANKFKGKPPISIAFVLCQKDEVGYCSRLCCLAAMKHAVRLSMAYLGTEVNVYYKSLRSCGRAFEAFRREAEAKGVGFLQTEVEKVEPGEEGWLKVVTKDGEFEADLVVLAEPLVPSGVKIAKMFGVELDQYGFPYEFQPRVINPLETHVERVFAVGTAKGFKDVQESVESGQAAALRIHEALKGREAKYVSVVETEKCSRCGMCVAVCPHGAINFDENGARIEAALCKGCGLCSATCGSKAIRLLNLEDHQLLKMAEVAFENCPPGEPRLLAFLCYWCSYAAGDLMGVYGEKIPEGYRSIRIRCSASLNPEIVFEILARDLADGVLVAGCPPKNCHHLWGNDMETRRFKFMEKIFKEIGIPKIARWEFIGVTMWPKLAKVLRSMRDSLKNS